MSWIAINTDTLNEAKVAVLITACSEVALAEGQDNRAPGIIQGMVNEVRAAVASCGGNLVDADTTKVPANLRDLCVDLIIARLKGAIEQPLTDDERNTLDWRRRQLREVASCALAVEQPDTPVEADVQGGPATELVREPKGNPYEGL